MITKEKNQLGASIVHTGRLLINSVNTHFSALGTNITFEQLDILLHIAMYPEKKVIQNDLAAMTLKNKSGILRIIDILEKKRYVKRVQVPNDRRKNLIEATESGIKIAKEAVAMFQKIEKDYLKKIKKQDITACNKVLDIIKNECQLNKS